MRDLVRFPLQSFFFTRIAHTTQENARNVRPVGTEGTQSKAASFTACRLDFDASNNFILFPFVPALTCMFPSFLDIKNAWSSSAYFLINIIHHESGLFWLSAPFSSLCRTFLHVKDNCFRFQFGINFYYRFSVIEVFVEPLVYALYPSTCTASVHSDKRPSSSLPWRQVSFHRIISISFCGSLTSFETTSFIPTPFA